MADLISSKQKLRNTEVQSGAIESEILNIRIGGNINGLIDETDLNEASIQTFEDRATSGDTNGSGTVLASQTVTVASNTITPSGTKVLVLPVGYFANDNENTITIKRNAITLRQVSITSSSFSGLGVLDTGATADSVNTYEIEINNTSGVTTTFTIARIELVEF